MYELQYGNYLERRNMQSDIETMFQLNAPIDSSRKVKIASKALG